jgi:hypothetical protein
MTDTAFQLRQRLMPRAPYRQWVLSFPFPLRFHLARDNAFFSAMLRGFVRTVFAWQRRRGRALGVRNGQGAAVAMIQLFGSAIQVHPHIHAQLPDGLWVPGQPQPQPMTFAELPPPTDEDVAALTLKIARRLTKVARRYLALRDDEWHEPDDEQAARDHCLQLAVRAPVRPPPQLPLGQGPAAMGPQPQPQPLCASVGGFSLHAATHVDADDREGLERLCKYGLRPPLAQNRLCILPDGRIRYELRRPWPTPDGATELFFEPLQLLRRLASLIPAPYTNMVRYFGAFAGRSKYRARLPLPPEARDAAARAACRHAGVVSDDQQLELALADEMINSGDPAAAAETTRPMPRGPRTPWAVLMKRAFGFDPSSCDHCGSQMVVMALITDVRVLERILTHLGLPVHPPPIAPARLDPQTDLTFDDRPPDEADLDEPPPEQGQLATSRAPP